MIPKKKLIIKKFDFDTKIIKLSSPSEFYILNDVKSQN